MYILRAMFSLKKPHTFSSAFSVSQDSRSQSTGPTELFLHVSSCRWLNANYKVKLAGVVAQLIAAVVLVSKDTAPDVYIPLGVCAFVFGMMEGGMDFWRG
jgi:hypothetical protein